MNRLEPIPHCVRANYDDSSGENRAPRKVHITQFDPDPLAFNASGEQQKRQERVDRTSWSVRRKQSACRFEQESTLTELEEFGR
jgi:hypothetical protein